MKLNRSLVIATIVAIIAIVFGASLNNSAMADGTREPSMAPTPTYPVYAATEPNCTAKNGELTCTRMAFPQQCQIIKGDHDIVVGKALTEWHSDLVTDGQYFGGLEAADHPLSGQHPKLVLFLFRQASRSSIMIEYSGDDIDCSDIDKYHVDTQHPSHQVPNATHCAVNGGRMVCDKPVVLPANCASIGENDPRQYVWDETNPEHVALADGFYWVRIDSILYGETWLPAIYAFDSDQNPIIFPRPAMPYHCK